MNIKYINLCKLTDLNMRVILSAGIPNSLTSLLMSPSKPISNILSASSMIRYLHRFNLTYESQYGILKLTYLT